jgi:hypothetical protein
VHFVLDPRIVPDNLGAPRYQSVEPFRISVGQPDLGQEIRSPQRREHVGIDLVRLDVRAIALTCSGLATMTRPICGNSMRTTAICVAGCLNDDFVRFAKAATETLRAGAGHADAST